MKDNSLWNLTDLYKDAVIKTHMDKPSLKELDINGVVVVPENITADEFLNQFGDWLDSKGYGFGGSVDEHDENDLPH